MSICPLPTVGTLFFDDVEVLDFCGPFEVFSTVRAAGVTGDDARLFRVVTIAKKARMINCRGGLLVQPHHTIAAHPALDLLVVPGGRGTRRERHNTRLPDWIVEQDRSTNITASVCTGAFLLAEAGLLDGCHGTTHWASIWWMRQRYPQARMVDDARVVDTGHIVTSAGVSAGIDTALHLVARLHGKGTATRTARHME